MAVGFRFLFDKRSLLYILLIFTFTNFFGGAYATLYRALLLARTGGSESAVVLVQLLIGIGGTAGALLVSFFGAPKRKLLLAVMVGYAIGQLFRALFGVNLSIPFLAAIGFLATFCYAYAGSCSNALWQSKIPPAMQGRVLAIRLALAGAVSLITRPLAGPLADFVFEPAMQAGGRLTAAFGWLSGVGPGAGMGLYMVLSCSLGVCLLLWGFSRPSIRNLDTLVPDHSTRTDSGGE